jgi:phosphatidate cytidylyltransferase
LPEALKGTGGVLAARVGTAAVLIALLLAGLLLLPPFGVTALMALIIGIGGFEWARLAGFARVSARFYAAGIVGLLFFCFLNQLFTGLFIAAAAFWLLAVPAWLAMGLKPQHSGALTAAGCIVLVPPALAVVVLGARDALLVLAVVWIADTVAYFVGRRWGRRKLAPAISPGKTWEGAAGGLAGAAAYAMIVSILFAGAEITRMAAFVGAAAALAIVSVVGDLFESAVKRQAGVKDSGAILPGHGGMLDRIDSATATLPVAALLVPLLKGPL